MADAHMRMLARNMLPCGSSRAMLASHVHMRRSVA